MKRVQVLLEPDCHKVLKCVCAQMGITMNEFVYMASKRHMRKTLTEHEHLKTLIQSLPLTPGSTAYNMREQITNNDQTPD